MPDFPSGSNQSSSRLISVGFVDARGDTRSVAVRLGSNPFQAGEIAALRQATADASNAGVYRETEKLETAIKRSQALAFDEAANSVNEVLVMELENNSGETLTWLVPAVDYSILDDQTRSSLITGDTGAAAGTPDKIAGDLREAVETAINNSFLPANSYEIQVTYVTTYQSTGGTRRNRPLPTFAEPTGSDSPPPDPAT